MYELPYQLNRTVVIKASPETVFRYFTDSARWAGWWGAGSTIDASLGGKVYIRHPNGVETLGEVLEVCEPDRIVFTYGFATGKPIPPGGSRVTIRLDPDEGGTRLHLVHEFAEAGPRDEHVQGWRFQLSLFSNLVANEVYADAASTVDAWFSAWAIADDKLREESLAGIAESGVHFRDRYSTLYGLADLTAHSGAALRFMPGIRMVRRGDIRHCQGTVLADWIAVDSDAKERMSGTNVFVFGAEGKIDSVTGFTNPPAAG
jgi:uncharacterized protein YndB with AHSA1/START domain